MNHVLFSLSHLWERAGERVVATGERWISFESVDQQNHCFVPIPPCSTTLSPTLSHKWERENSKHTTKNLWAIKHL
jgi:hypothetical protein